MKFLVTHQVLNSDSSGWNHGAIVIDAQTSSAARRAALNVLQHDNAGRRCVVRKVTELKGPLLQTMAIRPAAVAKAVRSD